MKTSIAIAIAIAVSLTTGLAVAQEVRFSKPVKFGNETVVLKVTNGYSTCDLEELEGLKDTWVMEDDPTERERLATRIWHCGEPEMLPELSRLREDQLDLVGAYAYLYLYGELSKINFEKRAPAADKHGHYGRVNREVAKLAQRLTPEQRKRAVAYAARLYKENEANCCMAL